MEASEADTDSSQESAQRASVRSKTLDSSSAAIALRRDLHRHPELRFQEHRTAEVVADRMRAAGFSVKSGVAGTGVVAAANLGGDGCHLVLRADMDALPIQDTKEVDYRSTSDGVAHACGHDVHMAVVATAAAMLAQRTDLAGILTVVFQPAEEIPFGEASGAQAMLDEGFLDELRVDAVIGLHCWPELPAGVIGIDRTIAMAAKDAFRISIDGISTHAATPALGRDAILAASHIVTQVHSLIGRRLNPAERAALNIGTMHAGRSQSVVPDRAVMTGTIRATDPETAGRLRDGLEAVVQGVASGLNLDAAVEWSNQMPVVLNDQRLTTLAQDTLREGLGVEAVRVLQEPPMTTDDFALFAERFPGLYLKLGVAAAAHAPPLHSADFDVDESAIGVGVEALVLLAEALLAR